MIQYYQHPYFLASSKDFYKKYIVNQSGGLKFKYHFDKFENRNGFFLGYRPHCVDVFIDEEHQEAIINNFSYFTNCSISGNFHRKDGTDKNSLSFL